MTADAHETPTTDNSLTAPTALDPARSTMDEQAESANATPDPEATVARELVDLPEPADEHAVAPDPVRPTTDEQAEAANATPDPEATVARELVNLPETADEHAVTPDPVRSTTEEQAESANATPDPEATVARELVNLPETADDHSTAADDADAAADGVPVGLVLALVVATVLVGVLFFGTRGCTPSSSGPSGDALDVDVAVEALSETYARDTRAAAQVDDTTISEGAVTARVMAFRLTNGLDTDDAWSGWLTMQSLTPAEARSYVLERMVLEEVVRVAAEERGIQVSDEELAEEVAESRARFLAGWESLDEEEQESRWQNAIRATQLDGLSYEDETRELLLESKLSQRVLSGGQSFADWYEAEAAKHDITVADTMPDDLPYALPTV